MCYFPRLFLHPEIESQFCGRGAGPSVMPIRTLRMTEGRDVCKKVGNGAPFLANGRQATYCIRSMRARLFRLHRPFEVRHFVYCEMIAGGGRGGGGGRLFIQGI